jgi:hypothetical protein
MTDWQCMEEWDDESNDDKVITKSPPKATNPPRNGPNQKTVDDWKVVRVRQTMAKEAEN